MNALNDPSVATGAAVDAALLAEADAAIAGVDLPAGAAAVPIAAPQPSPETAAMCSTLLGVTFNQLLAPRSGDHWKLAEDECKALGDAYGAVLDKYFPNLRTGPEVTAIVLTLALIGPRVMTSLEAERAKAKPIPAPAAQPAGVDLAAAG